MTLLTKSLVSVANCNNPTGSIDDSWNTVINVHGNKTLPCDILDGYTQRFSVAGNAARNISTVLASVISLMKPTDVVKLSIHLLPTTEAPVVSFWLTAPHTVAPVVKIGTKSVELGRVLDVISVFANDTTGCYAYTPVERTVFLSSECIKNNTVILIMGGSVALNFEVIVQVISPI